MPERVEPSSTTSRPRTWQEMRDQIARVLERRTGAGVSQWNERVAALGDVDEARLRKWLREQKVTGHAQNLLVMERLGYPAFLLASADELIEGQYADRPQLRPILDALLASAAGIRGAVDVQARKTYVTLISPKRTFALIRASTRDRVDLGLRLTEAPRDKRVAPATGLGNDYISARIALHSVDEVDDDVTCWLQRAYDENV